MLSLSSPVALLGLSILYSAYALKGIDVSVFLYNFDFKDYVLEGCSDFAIFQGYRNNGSVNLNLVNDSEESSTAGYNKFDMYMSPCPRCNKSASQQVLEMVTILNETMVKYAYHRIWIEVHVSGNWHKNQKINQKFLEDLLTETKKHKPPGVYTSELAWKRIIGKSHMGAQYPLWYVHNDTYPSFKDFKPFGGWTKPKMKQYLRLWGYSGGVHLDYSLSSNVNL